MNHKMSWGFVLGDSLSASLTATAVSVYPNHTTIVLSILGLSLLVTMVPAASYVAGWWSKKLLIDDAM